MIITDSEGWTRQIHFAAVIPARAGSKGIPGKNMRLLCGKPLVQWTIEAAEQAHCLDDIYVNTDCPEIAALVRARIGDRNIRQLRYPWGRPPELAGDEISMFQVLHQMLPSLQNNMHRVVVLQPTSPLRTAEDIDACAKLSLAAKSAVSVCRAKSHPCWTYYLNQNRLIGATALPAPERRQDLLAAYALTGGIYVSDIDWLLKNQTFVTEETLAYVMPEERSVDIDEESDFVLAEYYMAKRLKIEAERAIKREELPWDG